MVQGPLPGFGGEVGATHPKSGSVKPNLFQKTHFDPSCGQKVNLLADLKMQPTPASAGYRPVWFILQNSNTGLC